MRIVEPDATNLLSLTAAWAKLPPGDAVVYLWDAGIVPEYERRARTSIVRQWENAALHVKRIGERVAHIAVKVG